MTHGSTEIPTTRTLTDETAAAEAGIARVWKFREQVGTAQRHLDLLAAEQAWREQIEALDA